jgi:hypothetical protein
MHTFCRNMKIMNFSMVIPLCYKTRFNSYVQKNTTDKNVNSLYFSMFQTL